MSRSLQPFREVENRIDNERAREAKARDNALLLEHVNGTVNGLLGGFSPERQAEVSRLAVIRFCDQYAKLEGETAACALAGRLGFIFGPNIHLRRNRQDRAEAVWTEIQALIKREGEAA